MLLFYLCSVIFIIQVRSKVRKSRVSPVYLEHS